MRSRLTSRTMPVWVLGFVVLWGLQPGCQNLIRRGQSPDKMVAEIDAEDSKTRYIGRETSVWGLSFAKIQGIGLVTGLDGTGEDPGPSWQRDHLMEELRGNENIENAKDLLAGSDTAIVKVTGLIPPGAKKGDRFDLQIELLQNSETTSLKGGKLAPTPLRPVAFLGRRIREGNIMGSAGGKILVDSVFESRQDHSNMTRGWVLGGGVNYEERKLGLNLRSESQSLRNVTSITNAINDRFTVVTTDGRVGIAKAKTDRVIELLIPNAYRDNVGRLFQVIANMAYEEPVNDRVNRIDLLEKQLLEPAFTKQAALRLEAIGKDGTPALKRALKNPDIQIKFHAAASLAYLGESDGMDTLVLCAEKEPAYRWHAIAALSAISDVRAGLALSKLLHVSSAEARYGAFRALKRRSPSDPLVKGELVANDFHLHIVPSTAEPMLHFSRSQSPEIVLFGEDQRLSDSVLFVQSGLTVRSSDADQIELARFRPDGTTDRRTASNSTASVIREMAALGCDYSTMVEFFREVKQKGHLHSRLAVNALPRLGRQRLSAEWSDNDEETTTFVDTELPEMFGGVAAEERVLQRDDEARLKSSRGGDASDNKKETIFGKLNATFTKNKGD